MAAATPEVAAIAGDGLGGDLFRETLPLATLERLEIEDDEDEEDEEGDDE